MGLARFKACRSPSVSGRCVNSFHFPLADKYQPSQGVRHLDWLAPLPPVDSPNLFEVTRPKLGTVQTLLKLENTRSQGVPVPRPALHTGRRGPGRPEVQSHEQLPPET